MESKESLQIQFTYTAWVDLMNSTMISIMVLNRRRPGDIERLEINDYKRVHRIDKNSDAYKNMTPENKAYADHYYTFPILGKLRKPLKVLLPIDFKECLDLGLKLRKFAKVSENNPYVFGTPNIVAGLYNYLRASSVLIYYAEECGAEKPHTLKATELRKHVATHCAANELSETDVVELARFLGHREHIHRDIYRQTILQTDVLKISRFLESALGENITNNLEVPSNNSGTEDIGIESGKYVFQLYNLF